mmetsp:Transcript_17913/g.17118  ORF Transcript_17913/g.17118 Transcript_17913/m.17118 type:complete len:115 (+) Transcript_17913:330-674(+)
MEGYKYHQNEKGHIVPKIEENPNQMGLVQRSVMRLMEEVQTVKSHRRVALYVSFLQIYNEKIYDLLNSSQFKTKKNQIQFGGPSGDPSGLKLKWNQFDIFTVENLFTFECSTYE